MKKASLSNCLYTKKDIHSLIQIERYGGLPESARKYAELHTIELLAVKEYGSKEPALKSMYEQLDRIDSKSWKEWS